MKFIYTTKPHTGDWLVVAEKDHFATWREGPLPLSEDRYERFTGPIWWRKLRLNLHIHLAERREKAAQKRANGIRNWASKHAPKSKN